MKTKLIPLMIAVISIPSFAESIPGQELLSYFSANCRTQGEHTRAALADSTALIESLRSIQGDPDCKSVSGAISQMGLLSQQLASLEKTNDTQTKIAEMNAQEQELLIQISNNSNPVTLNKINLRLREIQVVRAGLIGREKSQQELSGPDKAETLSTIVNIANTAFTQVTANQTCLVKHPGILNTATSVMSAIGATAMVVNPALGLGLKAASALLGETIEGVHQYRNAREIRKIADNSIAAEGYKCALETMSERWCQMRDAESFLVFKAEQRQHPILKTGLGQAIRLNDREIPVLLEWLNKIRSGVTPTSTADADRRNSVTKRESYVRIMETKGLGLIAETRPIYLREDEKSRWKTIKSLIGQLVPSESPGFTDPLLQAVGSTEYAPFFLLGLEDDASIRNPLNGYYYSLDSWPRPPTFNPSLDLVQNRYIELIETARSRVNQELTQVLQPDALQTLTSAYDRTGNRWKVSPMDALKHLIEFLESNPPRESDFAFKKLYKDTIKKLKTIYLITSDAIIKEEIFANTPVEQIYEEAQLRFGTVVLEARLEMIVRLSLLELLETSPPADQVLVAQLLAAERFSETISKVSGTDNLAVIRADINRAQPMTISNLNSFMEVFGKNVSRILEKLKKEEERTTQATIARSKRYARTEMCFLLLAVPDINKYVNINYCYGLKMNSVIPGGPETPVINIALFNRDMNDRACEYREFFRKSKIFETWGIK